MVAGDQLAGDPLAEDSLAEDEAWASGAGIGEPMTSPQMAGHVRMRPARLWPLGSAKPSRATLDEAGLVNSVTGWRKITSWAQAQELAAVAEIGAAEGSWTIQKSNETRPGNSKPTSRRVKSPSP